MFLLLYSDRNRTIKVADKSILIKDTSQSPPPIEITGAASVSEGETSRYNLNNVSTAGTYYWSVKGINIDKKDVASLTGSTYVGKNSSTNYIDLKPKNDYTKHLLSCIPPWIGN